MIAARAISTPILPAIVPKATATRSIFRAGSPGANMLTTIAAVIKATKALTRSTSSIPTIVARPITRIASGCVKRDSHAAMVRLAGGARLPGVYRRMSCGVESLLAYVPQGDPWFVAKGIHRRRRPCLPRIAIQRGRPPTVGLEETPVAQRLALVPRMVAVGKVDPLAEARMAAAPQHVQQTGARVAEVLVLQAARRPSPQRDCLCVSSRANRSASRSMWRLHARPIGMIAREISCTKQQDERQRGHVGRADRSRTASCQRSSKHAREPIDQVKPDQRADERRPGCPTGRGAARSGPSRGPSRRGPGRRRAWPAACPRGRSASCRTGR